MCLSESDDVYDKLYVSYTVSDPETQHFQHFFTNLLFLLYNLSSVYANVCCGP